MSYFHGKTFSQSDIGAYVSTPRQISTVNRTEGWTHVSGLLMQG